VQTDYRGMSAFFAQVVRSRDGGPRIWSSSGDGAVQAKFLDGKTVSMQAEDDARRVLADWLTAKDNPYLARAVNRFWSYLFGKGIIDPVDDVRSSNPAVNEPLLAALAKDFVDHDFDVRHVLRTILNSQAYQRSSRTNAFNRDDRFNFSHGTPRRLSAEQLLDTLSQVTGVRENFTSRFGAGAVAQPWAAPGSCRTGS
jgi:hypothetical protein